VVSAGGWAYARSTSPFGAPLLAIAFIKRPPADDAPGQACAG
jgi:hypothetical protein